MSELKRFDGYQPIKEAPSMQLPKGGYIAQILDVHMESTAIANQRMVFQVEIIEGPFKDFFHREYDARQGSLYSGKYRGVYGILYPLNNSESELRSIDRFNKTMGAIEGSNPGYAWDWNLQSLKGRTVGLSVREFEYQGGIFTEIGKFIPVDIIRSGQFRPMQRRLAQERTPDNLPAMAGTPAAKATAFPTQSLPVASTMPPVSYVSVEDDEIPF